MTFKTRFLIPNSLAVLVVFGISTAWGVQADFKDRFPGRWEADKEKTKKYLSENEDAPTMPAEMLDTMPKFLMEFAPEGDAKITMEAGVSGDSRTLEGDWKIIEEIDADHAKLRVMMKVEEREDPKEVQVTFLDDDTIAFTVDNQSTIVLVRLKGENDNERKEDGEESKKDGLYR